MAALPNASKNWQKLNWGDGQCDYCSAIADHFLGGIGENGKNRTLRILSKCGLIKRSFYQNLTTAHSPDDKG